MPVDFTTVTPEQAGIPSRSIAAFLDALESREVALHSFLLLRHGKLAFETYYAPFERGTLHRMFSVSKSFVSLAVGLLCQEGLLCLDDRIAPYFQDKWPYGGLDGYAASVTLREMLMMTSQHHTASYKIAHPEDWVGSYFNVAGDHRAGDAFSYDTSATHTLAALCERVSGKPLLDYLREKCLDEIGFSKEAYFLRDAQGTSMGGSGLMAAPRDVLRVGRLLLQNGCENGKRLLPAAYLEAATQKQVDTYAKGGFYDCMQGYGYQFWRTTHNGYAMYGMGGQLCVCLPDRDIVFVTTADTQGRQGGVQLIYDAFWATIWPALSDGELPPATGEEARELARERTLPVVRGDKDSPWAKRVSGVPYRMDPNPAGIAGACVTWRDGEGRLTLQRGEKTLECRFGMGCHLPSQHPMPYTACAAWLDGRTLLITARLIGEAVGNVSCQLSFSERGVTLLVKKNVEYLLDGLDGIFSGVPMKTPANNE